MGLPDAPDSFESSTRVTEGREFKKVKEEKSDLLPII